MAEVMLIGEPMVIFYANDEGSLTEASSYTKGLAGAEVNVGIGLTRLGHSVAYMTKLSRDELGSYIFESLKEEKLASEMISFDETKQVGIMFKNKVSSGDPQTLYYRKGSAASTLSVADVKRIDFSKVKVLHVTGIPPALSQECREACFYMMKAAREAGCFITFDPNLRLALWESQRVMIETLNSLAQFAHLVLPGVEEGQLLTGKKSVEEIADFYLNSGADGVVMKLGGQGAFVKEKGEKGYTVSGFKVKMIVDTVGAGDGFAVGIISGYLDGLNLADSVKQANAIGAIQIQDASDNQALPSRKELSHFMNTDK
ncbi:sugar kinase [uncultured Vagococcus sp.]|uniref:sugar kinase n=1 Tax=uncultured Vagococcus sp. TaxID=189676 RepID=UPI0028D27DEE|nr:sugar kinase [uncultured Vagococcus sp.]